MYCQLHSGQPNQPPTSRSPLQTARGRGNLLRGDIDPAQLLRLVVRQRIHRRKRDVEARVGMVDREDIDALALVGELPARAARIRVPATDGDRAANVGELRERAEVAEALGDQPVLAVGAGDGVEAGGPVVVRFVVRERHAERGGGEERERSEGDGLELHVELGGREARERSGASANVGERSEC